MATGKADAATTPEAAGDDWQDIRTGLGGDEWDFDKDGALIGVYLGSTVKDLDDTNNPGQTRAQSVHQFAPERDPHEVVILWGSYQLDAALADDAVGIGSIVRIQFTGTRAFKSGDGQPRTVKQYKVQVKPS